MKIKLVTLAGALALLAIFAHYYSKPVLAQVASGLVQNTEEWGRTPYQEYVFATCLAQFCNFQYSAVPAGKRLVVTNISGFIDVNGGTLPNCNLTSSLGGSAYAAVYFTGVRGTVSTSSTRIFVNQQVLAYFGPSEAPHLFAGLVSTSDSFTSSGIFTVSGYYENNRPSE